MNNSKRFIELIKAPSLASPEDLPLLEEKIKQYPTYLQLKLAALFAHQKADDDQLFNLSFQAYSIYFRDVQDLMKSILNEDIHADESTSLSKVLDSLATHEIISEEVAVEENFPEQVEAVEEQILNEAEVEKADESRQEEVTTEEQELKQEENLKVKTEVEVDKLTDKVVDSELDIPENKLKEEVQPEINPEKAISEEIISEAFETEEETAEEEQQVDQAENVEQAQETPDSQEDDIYAINFNDLKIQEFHGLADFVSKENSEELKAQQAEESTQEETAESEEELTETITEKVQPEIIPLEVESEETRTEAVESETEILEEQTEAEQAEESTQEEETAETAEEITETITEEVQPEIIPEKPTLEEPILIEDFKETELVISEPNETQENEPSEKLIPEKQSFNQWLNLGSSFARKEEDILQKESSIRVDEVPTQDKKRIIEQFLEKNPGPIRISKEDKTKTYKPVEVGNFSELMTETLAQIYLSQKKYSKAIRAYKMLSLKYPEKSSFFANQISEIKKLRSNNGNI